VAERKGTVPLRDYGSQNGRVERLRDRLKFLAGAACVLDLARRQHDLEIGRQQLGALPNGRGDQEPADCRGRRVGAPLREP
jgi:hypothetical protein